MNNRSKQPTERPRSGKLNVPNLLSALRLGGSVVLVVLAHMGLRQVFLGLLIALLLTDWLDGKLAILLKQQTIFGARLDSIADTAMYSALLIGTCYLIPEFITEELAWIVAVALSFCLTSVAGLLKFRRLPSYHTRMAKFSWFLGGLGTIVLFADGSRWPLQIAMASVVLTNLEATAITATLSAWRANVPSLKHALSYRAKTRANVSK